ncbi:MAG TPA: TetR/AcrR family transcriptional regulator [Pseudonocardiaceae bacterium]|nr:TetR/AcrR family transcriptional regulator [Pseudonocardiaceae bacterium]
MPRSRNQTARRQQLLEAAVRVINDRGAANIHMKDVAQAASMATGSVYYYYDNVDELLRHVHALAFDRYYTARVAAISALDDPHAKMVTMVEMGLPRPADEPLSLALYQVGVAKARDPHHADMITQLCGQQRRLYQELLDDGAATGHFHPVMPTSRIAHNIIALEDGYGLGLCTGEQDYDYELAKGLILDAVSHWTQCPELLNHPYFAGPISTPASSA